MTQLPILLSMNSTSDAQQPALDVFLVDGFQPVRERIADMLKGIPGVTIIGEAETPADAVSGIFGSDPVAVVLDLQPRGGSGLEVLKAVHPKKRHRIHRADSTPAYEHQCLKLGASQFIDKSLDFSSVKQHLRPLRDGHPRH